MNLIENLERYTKYANGNESCAGELVVEDEVVNNVDFSKYDLNNSYFGGVTFNNCDFSNVYLSGSNFGGSIINKCNFKDNQLVKAEWDDMHFIDVVAIECVRRIDGDVAVLRIDGAIHRHLRVGVRLQN